MNTDETKEIECPSCALMAPADAEECPYCGYEFPQQSRRVRWMAWVFAFLLIYPLIRLIDWLIS